MVLSELKSQVFYKSLVKCFQGSKEATSRYRYSQSFNIEERFWVYYVFPSFRSQAYEQVLRDEILENKELFADWVGHHTDLVNSKPPELMYFYCTLIKLGITDDTSFTKKLKSEILAGFRSLNFADLGSFLFEMNQKGKPQFIPAETICAFISSKLNPSQNYPQKMKLFFENPIVRLKFYSSRIHDKESRKLLEESVMLYETMMRISESECGHNPTIGLKDILEVAVGLLTDYNDLYRVHIDSMMDILYREIEELRENDLVLLFMAVVYRNIRFGGCENELPYEVLSKIDSRLSRMARAPSKSILAKVQYLVKNSGLVDHNRVPFLSDLLNLKKQAPKSKNESISESEKLIVDCLTRNNILIRGKNTTIEDRYTVDILLDNKVCIEVNGYYHYTSSYIESNLHAPPNDNMVIHCVSTDDVYEMYRIDDVVRYKDITRKGYKVIVVDISSFMKDVQRYSKRLVEAIGSRMGE